MKIIVVGGGIGGLACALSCAKSGHNVTVLERQKTFTEIGAGIQLAPNAFHALDELGVGEAVKSLAVPVNELRLMDGLSGNKINFLSLGESYQKKFENPYMVVHRTDLYYPLLDACKEHENIELHTSISVSEYRQDEHSATVYTLDDRTFTGDIVIGADGIRSIIRNQMIKDGEPRVSGHTIFRAIVPMENVPEELRWNAVTLWSGPKWHFVHYPIASGKYMNLAATIDNQATQAITGEPVDSDTVRTTFNLLNDTPKQLMALGNEWKKWVLCDRDAIQNWIDNRVALLGDAAHPMLQYAAQGACMALEDAVVLGNQLKDATSTNAHEKLIQYNSLRQNRTERVMQAARYMGENVYHAKDDKAEERNQLLVNMTEQDIHNAVEWIHGLRPPFISQDDLNNTSITFKKSA